MRSQTCANDRLQNTVAIGCVCVFLCALSCYKQWCPIWSFCSWHYKGELERSFLSLSPVHHCSIVYWLLCSFIIYTLFYWKFYSSFSYPVEKCEPLQINSVCTHCFIRAENKTKTPFYDCYSYNKKYHHQNRYFSVHFTPIVSIL